MPAPHPSVRTALLAAGDRSLEDRIFTTPSAVVVLDGASQPDAGDRDGGWLADELGARLADALAAAPDGALAPVLADAIAAVAKEHGLVAGAAPSTTVSIVRWSESTVDTLVLGDSPIVTVTPAGLLEVVTDDRLQAVNRRGAAGIGNDDHDSWRERVARQAERRNQPGGYWIAEADPAAAAYAVTRTWPRSQLAAALVMTDGLANAVLRYGILTWPALLERAGDDLGRLLQLVHDAEAQDPLGRRWPRSKVHDDKAVAAVWF